MSYRRLLTAAAAAALCVSASPSQTDSASVKEPPVAEGPLSFSDGVAFKAWTVGPDLCFEVELGKPIAEGMFTCLHVYLDADNKPETGIGGAEMWLRASVGSRYHPNSYRPKDAAGKAAMDLRRASASRVTTTNAGGGGSGRTWLHIKALEVPEVGGKTIRFKLPTSMIREFGDRYGSVSGVWAEVETTCTDQPLMLRHLCGDEGISIAVDGEDGDWSQPEVAEDGKDELHPVAQFLDLTSLRVEHDKDRLFACVSLAQPGLASDDLPSGDIVRFDGVTFYVEPMFPRYQDPAKIFVRFGQPSHPVARDANLPRRYHGTSNQGVGDWHGAVKGKTVEIDIARKSGQNEFRVWAWSDLRRVDRMPNEGGLTVDWGKSK